MLMLFENVVVPLASPEEGVNLGFLAVLKLFRLLRLARTPLLKVLSEMAGRAFKGGRCKTALSSLYCGPKHIVRIQAL